MSLKYTFFEDCAKHSFPVFLGGGKTHFSNEWCQENTHCTCLTIPDTYPPHTQLLLNTPIQNTLQSAHKQTHTLQSSKSTDIYRHAHTHMFKHRAQQHKHIFYWVQNYTHKTNTHIKHPYPDRQTHTQTLNTHINIKHTYPDRQTHTSWGSDESLRWD